MPPVYKLAKFDAEGKAWKNGVMTRYGDGAEK